MGQQIEIKGGEGGIGRIYVGKDIKVLIVKPPLSGPSINRSWNPELVKRSVVRILDHSGNPVGSGFFINSDGYIITAHHVIYLLTEIWIEHQGRRVQVQYCRNHSDPYRDIAVLKCDLKELGEDIPEIPWMKPQNEEFGSEVDVWGFPADKDKKHYPDLFHVAGKLRPSHLLIPEHSSMESSLQALSMRRQWNVPYYKQGYPLKVYYIEDRTVPAGMSGSPVALRGAVIGFVHGDSREHVDYEGYIEGDRRVFVIRALDILEAFAPYSDLKPERIVGANSMENTIQGVQRPWQEEEEGGDGT